MNTNVFMLRCLNRSCITAFLTLVIWSGIVIYIGVFLLNDTELHDILSGNKRQTAASDTVPEKTSMAQRFVQFKSMAIRWKTQKKEEIPKDYIFDVYGAVQRVLGVNLHSSPRSCRLQNGFLTLLPPRHLAEDELASRAAKVIQFRDWLQERDIPFVYVQAPHKVCKYDPQLPRGLDDPSNGNIDGLLEQFQQNQIVMIDMREYFRDDPKRHYELFCTGDSHWKQEYAFLTFVELAKLLQKDLHFSIPEGVLNLNHYEAREDAQLFSGDIHRYLGRFYSPAERHYTLYPRFETRFHYRIPAFHVDEIKDYDPKLLGALRMMTVENLWCAEKKVLLIGDSFGIAFKCFLPLVCHEMEFISLNQLDLKAEKLPDVYERVLDFKPDVVVFLQTGRDLPESYFDYFLPAAKSSCEETQNTVE